MANLGWIPTYRSLQDHWLWQKKPFSPGQAWIDLLMLANYEDTKLPYKGEVITCERGTVNLSISALSTRWGWSRDKTRHFLKLLESDGMVSVNATTHRTTITIANYAIYNDVPTTDDTTNRQQTDNKPTASRQQADTTNNINNYNNITNTSSADTEADDEENLNETEDTVNYKKVQDAYNRLCPSYPTLTKLSDGRKKAIKARLKSYTFEELCQAFKMAEESDYLKGNNKRNWSATFDWIINGNNMAKILDGNYVNNSRPGGNTYQQRKDDVDLSGIL